MGSVMIDGVKYEPVLEGDLKIVVLDRGFVVVGRVRHEGCYVVITDCSCLRRWGTTAGLGQLAAGGPRAKTKLDPQPTTRVHELKVVQMIDCDVSKWTQ